MSKKKFFNILLGSILVFTLFGCDSNKKTNDTTIVDSNPQKLQILDTNSKLTQDQMLSQIKAEYLIENNGYKDDDVITVILSLEDDSVINKYNKMLNNNYKTVSDFIKSDEGRSYADKLNIQQENLIKKLKKDNLIENVLYKYTTVTNGIAVEMMYTNLSKVEGYSAVKYASLSETYNQVKTTSSSGYSVVENLVDVYENTGILHHPDKLYSPNSHDPSVVFKENNGWYPVDEVSLIKALSRP